MRIVKKVMLLIVVFIMAVALKGNTAFAESAIQVIPITNTNPVWTNISVSDAYDVCQRLNKTTSTLGTDKLKGHLTTNADWYAVSLLTYSNYGAKSATNTTGNKTGVMNFGTKYTYTASLMEGSTSNNDKKLLYDNLASNSPFVESVKKGNDRSQNMYGLGLLSEEILTTSLGGVGYGNNTTHVVGVRDNLFGFYFGANNPNGFAVGNYGTGAAQSVLTFRPVIWNK